VRVAQVLGNLLTNAAKYTEPNGRIGLSAEREGVMAVIRVQDNGIGIAEDVLPRIFDLFAQADYASTKAQGGLGIGLTLAKNLVEMHGGFIEAHSEGLGEGSRFMVHLSLAAVSPREGARTGQPRQQSLDRSAPPSGYSLLVVDDNEDAANSLGISLRMQGHEVRVAHSGTAALELAEACIPDAVFLDIGMPEMDGYEVTRQLRRRPGWEHVVLAALTGWGQAEDRRRTAEAGFNYHLVKPPDPKALESVFAELKRRRAP
jgi:CheY-like chemotaxis protein